GVPVVHDPARGEPERILRVRFLGWWHVVSRFYEGAAFWIGGTIVLRRDRAAGDQIMPVEFAIVCGRIEDAVRIEPFGPGRSLFSAGPLDPVGPVELVVAEVRVVAGTAPRAFSPGVESAFRVVPLDERLS